jgi:hypothetical protein
MNEWDKTSLWFIGFSLIGLLIFEALSLNNLITAFTILFILSIILFWVLYNLSLIKIAKYLKIKNSWVIWIPLPIFYFLIYLEMSNKSGWHWLWCILLSLVFSFIPFLIYCIYFNAKISRRLGFDWGWGFLWFIAPFYWKENLRKGNKG